MIRLLTLVAGVLFGAAAFADWNTSTFKITATYVDLVQLKKSQALIVEGKAVIAQNYRGGHLLVNGKPFDCRSAGRGVLVRGGREQIVCNMIPQVFLSMLNESADKGADFNLAIATLTSYFGAHSSEYTTIPVAIPGASGEEVSDYALHYLEPRKELTEVDFTYSASGVTPF